MGNSSPQSARMRRARRWRLILQSSYRDCWASRRARRMWRVMLAAVLAAAPILGFAQQNDIRVENAWSRSAMTGRTGVVYLTITDVGAPDRLTGAGSAVAASADLHESFSEHGVAKMRGVRALPVEPGKAVTLSPNGYHIM